MTHGTLSASVARNRFLILALTAIALAVAFMYSGHAKASEPQKLFALDAKEGSLTPVGAKAGVYRLVLDQVRGRATYFTDRPARKVGPIVVRRMLRELFAGDSPDPNAAVNASAAGRGQLLMGVELLGWRYDARRQELALRVRHLPDGGRTIGQVHEDTVLPRSFRDVSVFIDDCCSVVAPATVFNPWWSGLEMSINGGPQIHVPGVSHETWLPGSAAIPLGRSVEQPSALSPGPNFITVTPLSIGAPIRFTIELPNIQFESLQLYLFLNPGSGSGVRWIVCNSGRAVASGEVGGVGS